MRKITSTTNVVSADHTNAVVTLLISALALKQTVHLFIIAIAYEWLDAVGVHATKQDMHHHHYHHRHHHYCHLSCLLAFRLGIQ